jgi:small-conductance mechanosensitive channel
MDDLALGISRDDLEQTAIAAAILAGGLVLAWLVSRLLHRAVHLATHATETDLDDAIARDVRLPVVGILVVQAAYIALRSLSYLDQHADTIQRLWAAASLLVAVVLIWRVVGAAFAWYGARAAAADSLFGQKSVPILRRIVNVTIVLVGAVIVLDQLGIAISPLLAGLGIGGLAVALAAQPILANVFAGSYVLSDGSIGVDDFIELEGGPTGWVEDIGLRATRVRTFDNNLVLIPNSTLAEATVTNFDTGDPPVGAPVICGVAYEEDLEAVEALVLEVLAGIVSDLPEADAGYEPLLRFQAFGESNIDFLMKLRATNRRDVGRLQHEMIKRVHTRFAAAGIVINYPARRLFLEEDDTAGLARLAPSANGGGGS